ncbi:RAVE protein 1 C terminal-domain-containing protein [Dipodascopsis uninucleata]
MASPGLHPGKPNPIHQAFSTAYWGSHRLLVYVSGNNLIILSQRTGILQIIYLDRDGGAVEIEEITGSISVISGPKVLIYAPISNCALSQWSLKWTIHLDLDDGIPTSVNWGTEEELFIAGRTVSLWGLFRDGPQRLWKKQLAVPAMISAFSFDAYLAATVGKNDRLVKVWRRFSYDISNADFDFSYLPHPRAVTGLRWRKPFSRSQTVENILYTICADGVLRIWAPTDSNESSYMQMWSSLDLYDVLPRKPPTDLRYTFLIDNKDFTRATESAVRNGSSDPESKERLDKLIEIASRNPDICIVLDQCGRMAALGIENIGSRISKAFSIFDIVRDDDPVIKFPPDCQYMSFLGFGAATPDEPDFALYIHDYNGTISYYRSEFTRLLYSGHDHQRMVLSGSYTGHYKSVKSLVRTADGKAMLSSSGLSENILWKPKQQFNTVMLDQKSILLAPDKVQKALILPGGSYVVTIQSQDIVLWNCSELKSRAVAHDSLSGPERKTVINLFVLPDADTNSSIYHIVAVFADQHGALWEVIIKDSRNPLNDVQKKEANVNRIQKEKIDRLQNFKFPVPENETLLNVIPVDPVGWNATLIESIDKYTRDVANSITSNGVVRSWTARVHDETKQLQWLETAMVETGIKNPSLAKGSTMKKLAIVDTASTRLTIWDIGVKHLEFEEIFSKSESIRDLDWSCTPDSQSILAVGFSDRVILYCQLRFDYTKELPAWASFREINIKSFTTRSIADSIWLDDGTLVIGSGNQLFTQSKKVDTHKAIRKLHLASHKLPLENIFDIVSVLNGPLPLYHPQLVAQSIFLGKAEPVRKMLVNLLKQLKFTAPNDSNVADIDSNLNIDINEFLEAEQNKHQVSQVPRAKRYEQLFSNSPMDSDDLENFSERTVSSLMEYLSKISLPYLTNHQQISLVAMIEALGQVEEHRRSLDENGIRYLLAFRLFILHRDSMIQMPYRDHNWAYHSNSQEILVDLVTKSFNNRMSWPQAKEAGLFFWLKSPESLKQQFESVARIIYTESEPRNPIDCSLFYLALKKKQVLLGLWRMASWHKEQAVMLKFLANNFADPRWKTAALKNAYVLLGKQRYEYSAAFFLLGDSLRDAINVCLRNLDDLQLAVAIARIYEGSDDGPVFKDLLQKEVLPTAYRTGDRWLASWAFSKLNRNDLSLKCLYTSYKSYIGIDTEDEKVNLQSKMFLVEDPLLVVLYRQIRDSLQERVLESVGITPKSESDFVLRITKLYDRMGCDLLALDLVKNWEFIGKKQHKKAFDDFDESNFIF